MKKTWTRLLSIFLAVLMLASVFPLDALAANEAAESALAPQASILQEADNPERASYTIEDKITDLCVALGIKNPDLHSTKEQKGIYFTTDKKKANSDSDDRTKNFNVTASYWFIQEFGYGIGPTSMTSGWSCTGFAKFATWYLYVGNPNKKESGNWSSVQAATKDNIISKCKIGDRIQFYTNKRAKCPDDMWHTAIYLDKTNKGIIVLDSNYNKKHDNIVKIHLITYDRVKDYFFQRFTSSKTTVSPYVAPQPDYTIKKVTAKSSNKSATITVELNKEAKVSEWAYFISTDKSALLNQNAINGNTSNIPKIITYKRIRDYSSDPKLEKADSFSISKYNGEALKTNKTYYYIVRAKVKNKWYASNIKSFTTGAFIPDAATLRVSRDSQVVGIGDPVILLWDSAKNAGTYNIEINVKGGAVVQHLAGIKGTTYTSAPFAESGEYTATITSVNEAGEVTGSSTEFTVAPNRLVRFYDTIAEEVIYEESVPYGHDATAPKAPQHYGHTFSQWSRSYTSLTEDGEGDDHVITVNTVYDLNTFSVRFIDSFTNEIISTQSVKYGKPAAAPVSVPTHKGFTFVSWDKAYSSIEADTDIYTVYQWADPDHLAALEIDSVTRTIPQNESDINIGYDVTVTITNSASRIISGRVVAVLKSPSGTILSQSESAAFAVDKATTDAAGNVIDTTERQVTFTVLYDDLAYQIELYLINDYNRLGQLSPMVSVVIDNNGASSGWIRFDGAEPPVQSDPANGITVEVSDLHSDTVKYYRYRILEKSYETSAPTTGYTQAGYTRTNPQEKSVSYVASWPTGFLKTHSLYTKYNKQPVAASETATQITEIGSTATKGYIYYHWCYGESPSGGPLNRWIEGAKGNKCNTFHAFERSTAATFNTSAKCYKISNKNVCPDTYWWYGLTPDKAGNIVIKTQNYTIYDKLYNYYSDYSEWIPYEGETCPLTNGAYVDGDLNRTYEVETKTETDEYYCYRYTMSSAPAEPSIPDSDPRVIRISGTVGSQYAGNTATVWVYKYTQASDFTTEYVGNTVIDSNGQITIARAVLREAPSVQSGDYTIVVTLPGQEQSLYLGTVAAPKATYTVVFEDASGNVISTQTVEEGDSAVVPDAALANAPAGYRFARWSESVVNVRGNLNVKPEFEKMTFVVAFVDWNDQSVVLNNDIEYGSELVSVGPPAEIEGYNTEWVVQVDGTELTIEEFTSRGLFVTGNMVVTTRNTEKVYSVIFLDVDPNGILEDRLEEIAPEKLTPIGLAENTENLAIAAETTAIYGIGIDFSDVYEIEESNDYEFMGWINAATGEALETSDITESVVLYPRYVFVETVEPPTASVDSGEFTEAISVELIPEFETASIWYTLDGSDPKTSDTVIEYTSAIAIDHSCILRYYSSALGYNDSEEDYRVYAVNLTNANRYHVVTVYCIEDEYNSINDAPSIGLVQDGTLLPTTLFADSFTGLSFEGIYSDIECTESFDLENDTILASVVLYACYEPTEYTVMFYDFYGNILSEQTVAYSEPAEAPEAPEVDDYVFACWDGDYWHICEDLDVFARYITPEEYAAISFDKDVITLNVGESYANLQTAIAPLSHSDYTIEWASRNEEIASVDEAGVITAHNVGTAVITATLPYTGATAEVTVKVAHDLDWELVLLHDADIGFDSERNLRVTPSVEHTVSDILAAFENANLIICNAEGAQLAAADTVGTGCVVKLMSGEELLDSATIILVGDYNGDGMINNKDVVMLNQLVLEKREADYWQALAVDVNGDGYVNNKDCAMLARYLVGKETI